MPVKCQITLPDTVIRTLGFREHETEPALKKELAVHFFQMSVLSFGQARQLAELSVWDFLELLRERKVALHYGIPEYEEDLKTIQDLSQ